jgi:hypothetical protein
MQSRSRCPESHPAGAIAALEPQLRQQLFRRAEAGEAALQQVEADEGGEGEEPFGDENRAAVQPRASESRTKKPAMMRMMRSMVMDVPF